jgi:eukaryotic-like serine/threonine-protein kinase
VAPDTGAPGFEALIADRYELVRLIARGDLSDVYEGRDRLLQRSVAVKVYRPEAPVDPDRLEPEIVALVAHNNPGAVELYDAGDEGGDLYIVMELVKGPTLRSVLSKRGALEPLEAASFGVAVADAVAFVHAAGVVHTDLNPANVLCARDGSVRLADLGSIRVAADTDITGDPTYLAPEQVKGDAVTPAVDVYALGVLLLELLMGPKSFERERADDITVIDLDRDAELSSAVPAVLRPLVRQMTSREPSRRPPAAAVGDRLAALVKAAQDPGVSMRSPSPMER